PLAAVPGAVILVLVVLEELQGPVDGLIDLGLRGFRGPGGGRPGGGTQTQHRDPDPGSAHEKRPRFGHAKTVQQTARGDSAGPYEPAAPARVGSTPSLAGAAGSYPKAARDFCPLISSSWCPRSARNTA